MPRGTRSAVTMLVFAVLLGGLAAPSAPAQRRSEKGSADGKKGFSLTITGEVDAEMAPVVGHLTTVFYQSYPKLVERFEHPEKPAPRSIRIVMKNNMRVPAYCSGSEISVSTEWLRKHPGDVALLTHELTHAVQAYPRFEPGWLTEGIADYARQVYGPKQQPDWSLPSRLSPRQGYKDGYRVTARFLVWLDEKHPGTIDKIHRKMQDRDFDLSDFQKLTGSSIDALWEECVRDLAVKKP